MSKNLTKGYSLKDGPFFRLRSKSKLASLLQVSPKLLCKLSSGQGLYRECWRHKRKDIWRDVPPTREEIADWRPIDIPDARLKSVQARIYDLLSRCELPGFVFSPAKGRSYVDNAGEHVGSVAFWALDIADYFPSTSRNNVIRFFRRDLQCSVDVAVVLANLVCYDEGLPQGSPCSPILAYYANMHMWLEICDLVKRANCRLSVYADDISISSDTAIPKSLIWEIKKVIHKHGLKLKASKEASAIFSTPEITGVIVGEKVTRLPNRQLKALHDLKKEFVLARSAKERGVLSRRISGRISQRKQVERRFD